MIEYPKWKLVSDEELENVYPMPSGFIKRVGYSGFLSAIWALWKMNRGARRGGYKAKFEVIVPLRWLR